MTRDDDRDRIRTASRADGPRRARLADFFRDPTVRTRFTAGYFQEGAPNELLKGSPRAEIKRDGKAHLLAGGVGFELPSQWTGRGGAAAPTKFQPAQAAFGKLDAQRAKFCCDCYRTTTMISHSVTNDSPSHIKKRLRVSRWTRFNVGFGGRVLPAAR